MQLYLSAGFAAGFFQLWRVGGAQGQIDNHLLSNALQHNTALTLVLNSSWVDHITLCMAFFLKRKRKMAENGAFNEDCMYLQGKRRSIGKNGESLCLQHLKRGMAHMAKKQERGLELVKNGKNDTERNKGCDVVQEREQHGTVSLGMSKVRVLLNPPRESSIPVFPQLYIQPHTPRSECLLYLAPSMSFSFPHKAGGKKNIYSFRKVHR